MTQYDLNSAEFIANPYPVYDQLRTNDPVYWSEEHSYWFLTRYADIVSLIQNNHLSSNRIGAHANRLPEQVRERFSAFFSAVSSWLLMIDPPDHARPPCPAEKLFQGPIADALTHVGQIAMLRRFAGDPMRGENYFVAEITIGRVSTDQAEPRFEFE